MSSNPQPLISDDRTVDTLLKSIRSKLRANRATAAARTNLDDPEEMARLLEHIRQQLNHGQRSVATPNEVTTSIAIKSQDISRIDLEVAAALSAHRQVGQLNPRPPGFRNRALQAVKKTMRRSLAWYTRPLQHFQDAVLRALQNISAVLQKHDNSLRQMESKADSLMALSGQQIADVRSELEALKSEVAVLTEELRRTNARGSGGETHS